jgi:hypothetical protein
MPLKGKEAEARWSSEYLSVTYKKYVAPVAIARETKHEPATPTANDVCVNTRSGK